MSSERSTVAVALCVASVLNLLTAEFYASDNSWSVYYVKPSDTEYCPPHFQPCHTLEYYVNYSNMTSNSTFLFLKGLHTLQFTAEIGNVTNLALIGVAGPEDSKIQCEGPAGFYFRQLIPGNLTISNLLFSNCGGDIAEGSCGALILDTVLHLNMTNVIVENSTGYGLLGYNILGNSFITGSVFRYNRATQDCLGGNTWFYYNNCPKLDTATSLVIDSSELLFGYQPHVQFRTLGSGGLNFAMNCTNVHVNATNLRLYGNEGYFAGNAQFYFMLFTNVSITLESSYLGAGQATRGAGALVAIDDDAAVNDKDSCGDNVALNQRYHKLVHLSNVKFSKNSAEWSGAGFQLEDRSPPGYKCTIQSVVIENSVFWKNFVQRSWFGGAAVRLCTYEYSVMVYDIHTKRNFQTEFRNTIFEDNAINSKDSNVAIVTLESYPNVTFTNCTFINNKATAIRAIQNDVIFQGNNSFYNNVGNFGTGLSLFMNSYMYLKPYTKLLFANNHARTVGGAIFTDLALKIPEMALPCFFQVLTEGVENTTEVDFINNTAGVAGSSLYGGYIDRCAALNTDSLATFKKIFHYNHSDPSVVSSDAVGVCFCSNSLKPDCQNKVFQVTAYPGGLLRIPAVLVGQLDGTVPGVIHSSFQNGNSTASIGNLQESQRISKAECALLSYSVFSTNRSENLTLLPEKAQDLDLPGGYNPAFLVVSLRQCPTAFVLSNVSGKPKCDCTPILSQHHAKCYIDNQTILRPPMTWIGYHKSTGNTSTESGVLFHQHCPFDYCNNDWSLITINSTDTQCLFNHSGILCGGCKPGLSLTLGSSLCQYCSDQYLALLTAFAAAGVVLVIFLVASNATVTEGTINGLIFYANIVRMNHDIFFPPQKYNVLSVFMAWINLDLGIRSCFYNGLDGYAMTWLQFAFPLYIWTIVIFVITLSRKYRIVAKLISKNAVKVLATLLLLSYTKLLRTIITVLSDVRTYIVYPDNSKRYVWLYDGNVDYLKGKHIYSFTTSVVFLLVLVIPYTLVLVSVQSLQAKSEWRILSWVNKLKPLFDAYTGPYRDKYRFWTGFLLLVRSILFFIFTFNTLGDPSLNLLVITLASLVLSLLFGVFHPVYKKRYCNILEFSFYLNLGAVSVAVCECQRWKPGCCDIHFYWHCFLHICWNCTLSCIPRCDLSSHNVCHLAVDM